MLNAGAARALLAAFEKREAGGEKREEGVRGTAAASSLTRRVECLVGRGKGHHRFPAAEARAGQMLHWKACFKSLLGGPFLAGRTGIECAFARRRARMGASVSVGFRG